MKLGMVGLGRMVANMAQRLMRGGHQLAGFDPKPQARKDLEGLGAESADSLAALVVKLPAPRVVWLMVPAGAATEATLASLAGLLAAGDAVIDGGNSNYKDTARRAATFPAKRIEYVDCGTSGGVWGLAEGYSLMIGGDEGAVERTPAIFLTLGAAEGRRSGPPGSAGAGRLPQ